MKQLSRALTAAVLTVASSCGGPASAPLLPGIEGQILERGRPVPDLTVSITGNPDDAACRERTATAVTGPDGRFRLPATLERGRVVVRNPADVVVDWRVCFDREGEPVGAWNGYSVGAAHAPALVEIRCDLALSEDERCAKTRTVWE